MLSKEKFHRVIVLWRIEGLYELYFLLYLPNKPCTFDDHLSKNICKKSSFLTARFLKLRKNFRTDVFDGEFRRNGVLDSLGSRNSTSRNFLRSFFERFCGICKYGWRTAKFLLYLSYHWIYYDRFWSFVAYILEMIVLHIILINR